MDSTALRGIAGINTVDDNNDWIKSRRICGNLSENGFGCQSTNAELAISCTGAGVGAGAGVGVGDEPNLKTDPVFNVGEFALVVGPNKNRFVEG